MANKQLIPTIRDILKDENLFKILLLLVTIITPGLTIIFVFYRDLIKILSPIVLFSLCAAFSAPYLLVGLMLYSISLRNAAATKKKTKDIEVTDILFYTFLVFYITLASWLVFYNKPDIYLFFTVSAAYAITFVLGFMLTARFKRKKQAKKRGKK